MRTWILGTGYTGHRLAVDLRVSGHEVLGTARRSRSENDRPYPHYGFDLKAPGAARKVLERAGWADGSPFGLVFLAGPPPGTSVEAGVRMMEDFVSVLPFERLRNFVYVSSTSVYGDAGGDWVDESSPLDPVSRSGELKVRCERLLRDRLEPNVPVLRVRPGGIYGPGRNGPDRYLADDYTLVGGGEKWTNRIHVVDLVRLLARLASREESVVLNAVDGRPVRLHRMVEFLYREAGRDPEDIVNLSWEEARDRFSEMRLGLLKPQKRVSARNLRRTLDFSFRYPNVYRGLNALMGNRPGAAASTPEGRT